MNVLNDCAPERNITIPYKSDIKLDWMTPSLIKCSRKCEQLYKKAANKSKDSPIHLKYSRYRNIFNCAKRTAKKKYYQTILNEYRYDIRKTWKVMNSIIGRTQDKSSISEKCIINGRTETDPNLIADGFGKYSSGIGKQFAEAIPQSNHSPEYYMSENQNVHTMFMNPTDPGEIAKIIGSCKSKKKYWR